MSDNELMTLGETADYLRVNKKTIYRLLERKAIPSVKVGHQWRFNKSSIDGWLSTNTAEVTTSVLIIDDDREICEVCASILEPEGLIVSGVTNPLEGLELIETRDYDLVFIDLKMPEINGAELFRRIKAAKPDLPVIILTGYPDSDLMDEALQCGPIAVIKKPFTETNLFSAINTYLHLDLK